MTRSRREFIQLSAIAGGAVALGMVGARAHAEERVAGKPARKLKILVLGGTGLIGPPLVEYALARGHEVTLFNRGKTNTDLFPKLEKLRGDRDGDLKALEGDRTWDAVVDDTASIPRWVHDSANLLKGRAKLYLFTSSISAYADTSKPGMTEDAPVATMPPEEVEKVKTTADVGNFYGALKALCEEEARHAFPDGALIVRPGLIVGPGDRSDRWTYWPVRVHRGGEVLAPGTPDDPVQFIDTRDLGEWYVRLLEDGVTGTFHATGPASRLSMAEMLYGLRATTAEKIAFTWVPADFLAEHDVQPWSHMPAWVPPVDEYAGFALVDCSKAQSAGLTFRPMAITAFDTVKWWDEQPEERQAKPRAGLDPAREKEVLAAWHVKKATWKAPARQEG